MRMDAGSKSSAPSGKNLIVSGAMLKLMAEQDVCPFCLNKVTYVKTTFRGDEVEVAICRRCGRWVWFTLPLNMVDESGEVVDPEEFRALEDHVERFVNETLHAPISDPPYIA